jgi:hypothetical protein
MRGRIWLYVFLHPLLNFNWISKIDAVGQTHIVGACGDKPLIHPMVTEVTFLRNAFTLVKSDGVVGACIDTGLAASAFLVIYDHDTVVSFADCLFRARIGARGVIAVPAYGHSKKEIRFSFDYLGSIL